jgi:hypothetical protein
MARIVYAPLPRRRRDPKPRSGPAIVCAMPVIVPRKRREPAPAEPVPDDDPGKRLIERTLAEGRAWVRGK